MGQLLSIALGGAIGALGRYGVAVGVTALAGRGFPYATLLSNVVGSVLMGACFVWFVERAGVSPELRLGVMVGVLGAFTTFSTFSLETLALLQAGRLAAGFGNVAASVVLCIAGCWLGMALARAPG